MTATIVSAFTNPETPLTSMVSFFSKNRLRKLMDTAGVIQPISCARERRVATSPVDRVDRVLSLLRGDGRQLAEIELRVRSTEEEGLASVERRVGSALPEVDGVGARGDANHH